MPADETARSAAGFFFCAIQSIDTPGRYTVPLFDRRSRPFRCFVRVAAVARIWNFVLIRHVRRHEVERVATDIDVGNRLFDLRHVA